MVHYMQKGGKSALMIASQEGNSEIIVALLEGEANVNLQTEVYM